MKFKEIINQYRFSILMGKNGSGKSTILRSFEGQNFNSPNVTVRYITPERGGSLEYEPGVDGKISRSKDWLAATRRVNRYEQFRQQSMVQFRNLETQILREIEQKPERRKDISYTFDSVLDKINALLPVVTLRRTDRGFSVFSKNSPDTQIENSKISSGESELIALAIEILVFSRSDGNNKVLLLDEPDVHLHPDLQVKFTKFLIAIAEEYSFKVVIATHSTAILSAFTKCTGCQLIPLQKKDQQDFTSFMVDEISKQLLPVFGIHPLSQQFNDSPILLVEGDDDRRVFEQVVRSSGNQFCFNICPVNGQPMLQKWEKWLNDFLPSIYDSPKAYSLRDLDSSTQEEIDDCGIVFRSRLACRSIENLLLCNEVLEDCGKNESDFIKLLKNWNCIHPDHQNQSHVVELIDNFDFRQKVNIKPIRNIIVALLEAAKPWEVLIGQVLAKHLSDLKSAEHHSINAYLGRTVVEKLFHNCGI